MSLPVMAWMRREASTRSASLVRIGVAALVLTRFSDDRILFRDSSPGGILLSLAFYGLATTMLIGWYSRASAALLFAILMYFYHGLGGDYVHHHTYLLSIMPGLLALTPCGGSYSLDRWRALQRAEAAGQPPPPEQGPIWALSLITVQLSMVYFWGAVDKSDWAYLSGTRMQQYFMHYYADSEAVMGPGAEALMAALAISSVLLEYVLAVGLWVPRVRLWAVLCGAIFHGILYATLPVSTFTVTMWVLYLAAFDPDAVHRVIERLSGRYSPPAASARSDSSVSESA